MCENELTLLAALLNKVADPAAPARLSIGFARHYRQQPPVLDWLGGHDVFDAIEATRAAVRKGYIDESADALAERERVRQLDDLDQFIAERDEARAAYDTFCMSLPGQLQQLETMEPPDRLALLAENVHAGKVLDERLHAYIVNYNRPGTLVTRLIDRLAARAMPVHKLVVPFPLPTYAIIEGLFALTMVELLDGAHGNGAPAVAERIKALMAAGPPVGEVVSLGAWVFARGSEVTLDRRLTRGQWLLLTPTEAKRKRADVIRRYRAAQAEYQRAARAAESPELAAVTRLLRFDHVEDALRSAVYNGLEDYMARQWLARELRDLGVIETVDPMDYSQDWLLSQARRKR